ncbi:MAG: N-acetyltransferase [Deltaproteobacteria bacterium]|jgi:putative acetyltransferase|nr:N-acetyltransferase [Deltaproteobacteria bacterium]
MSLSIRSEREADFTPLYSLVQEAFAAVETADGDEQDFVLAMRRHSGYIRSLALVAEKGGELVGFVMLTRTEILGKEPLPRVLLLAPLCVAPAFWGWGIGSALMAEAFSRAVDLGFTAVFLAGDPGYYSRFGFLPSVSFGISHHLAVPDRFILAKELVPGALEKAVGMVILTGHTTCASATGGIAAE